MKLHKGTLETAESIAKRWLAAAVLVSVIILCVLPMGLSPSYNGEIPDYTDQYEHMAESILNGQLYLEYDDTDPKLLAMEKPYDFEAIKEQGGPIIGTMHSITATTTCILEWFLFY